jgi:hypothetical protein
VFVRWGRILNLHVGGQVIQTTQLHPFWVYSKGWVEAGQLQIGDLLVGHDGQRLRVEDLLDTEEYATVYNVRVADHHTYFVGRSDWGVSVWAHNACQVSGKVTPAMTEQYGIKEVAAEAYAAAETRKLPHLAKVTHYDVEGNLVGAPAIFESGGTTVSAGQTRLNWQQQAATHTEAQIAREYAPILQPGETLAIEGLYAPCESCQARMIELRNLTGAEISYTWLDVTTNARHQWWAGAPHGLTAMP